MTVLIDTHVWAWTFIDVAKLPHFIKSVLVNAPAIFVSPASIYEIAQKSRLGKWSQMDSYAANLPTLVDDQGFEIARLSPDVMLQAGALRWDHRDPFDRMLAATALTYRLDLVSADVVFDGLHSEGLRRIWRNPD